MRQQYGGFSPIDPNRAQLGGINAQARVQNQMDASGMPVDLNAIASPQWQRYFSLLKSHGQNLGGKRVNFDPGQRQSLAVMTEAQSKGLGSYR